MPSGHRSLHSGTTDMRREGWVGFRPVDDLNDTVAAASPGLFHTHVPFDKPPDLPFGIAVLHHPSDEIVMLLFGLAVLLRAERNHRQQVLDLREYPLFDHFADFFVRGPGRILTPVTSARPQRELHHLVAEILGIGD